MGEVETGESGEVCEGRWGDGAGETPAGKP